MSKDAAKAFREEAKNGPVTRTLRELVSYSANRPTCVGESIVAVQADWMLAGQTGYEEVIQFLGDVIEFAQVLRLVAIKESAAAKKAK